ncbi:MAG: hypothetical protein FWG06_03070, partial [Clostridiales bacterium]|nr:hypothetical protein [Clostridiales bacterium]
MFRPFKTVGPEPWHYKKEPITEQVERYGYVVAEIRLNSLTFSGPGQTQAVNEHLLFYQGLKLAEYRAWAERYFDEAKF